MKRVLYIICILFIVSCSNRKEAPRHSNEAIETTDLKQEDAAVLASAPISIENKEFAYQKLTSQKLQDYYDLLLLQNQHPEFQNEIKEQLQELSTHKILIAKSIQSIRIQNVQQLEDVIKISDSLQRIKFSYDISTGDSIKTDTITAIIKTNRLDLDGTEVIATKIKFTTN